MNLYQDELYLWEVEQEKKNSLKVYGMTTEAKDPQRNKHHEKERKTKQLKHVYKKESKRNRKRVQKRFRRKWTSERNQNKWHIPVSKEFHTDGWLTW